MTTMAVQPDPPTTIADGRRSPLDPAALARLKNLHLAARLVVEGLFSGQHRSPRKGFSVEFAEHRQYSAGDDPRHLDWKLMARRERLYVKQYEEQTNLRAYILLDASASMNYRHSGPMTKLEYGSILAASLAWLMQSQHDAFGLISFADKVREFVPPRQGKGHLHAVIDALQLTGAAGTTDLPGTFHELAERMKRRALVIVISDLLSDAGSVQDLIDAIGHFRHRKHEVIVMQTLDPAELEFPFRDAGQIEDAETGRIITADAEAIRNHYLEQMTGYLQTIERGCTARQVGYALARTTTPPGEYLASYLTRRHAMDR